MQQFDITGLLAGLDALKNQTSARNIVFDGLDMLLSGLHDERLERQELSRLDEWVRNSGMSAVMTVKTFGPSNRDQVRSDFLQYITDCVVILEYRGRSECAPKYEHAPHDQCASGQAAHSRSPGHSLLRIRISTARLPIHSRFIRPPTNSSAISNQQQPRQKRPW